MDMVNANCDYVGSPLVPGSLLFSPLTNNIMSYYEGCLESFTNGQGERARKALEHGISSIGNTINYSFAIVGVRNSLVDLEFNTSFEVPAGKKLYMNRNIVVNTGSVLTIRGKLLMGPNKNITVFPGGKLIVDGGEINLFDDDQLNPCLASQPIDYWGGVTVLGVSTFNQAESNQGTVILNDAKIAKSRRGIGSGLTFKHDNSLGTAFSNVVSGGGIILAKNTVFENNVIAVRIGKYNAYRSRSKFINCQFVIDEEYSSSLPARGFVSLFANKGVEFGGCDFINAHTASNLTENMYGIMSTDASFFVGQYCLNKVMTDCIVSGDSSTFQGLKYGIRAHKISSNNTYHVHASRFIGNKTGVLNAGVDFPVILRNRFEFGWQPSSGDTSIGVLINTGTGFRIEDNRFYKDETYANTSVGILVANSGAASNEVYNNLIEGLDFGLVSNGVNRNVTGSQGLIYKCNDIANTAFDISVIETRLGSGVAFMQLGTSLGPHSFTSAANKFSLISEPESDILNNTQFNIAYFFSEISREEPIEITTNKVLPFLTDSFICKSKISGQFQSIELSDSTFLIAGQNLNNNVFDYLSLLYSYHNLIDEGHSTAYFETLVNLHGNDEIWQLRQSLIEQSPYLSTETLIDAVRSEILPNALLLEVILANPDASNNDDLMNALIEKQNPMPGYMIELIEASWGQETLRTLMEANLTALSSAVYRDLKYMVYNHAVDSLNRDMEISSLLENATDLQSKYTYAINLALNNHLNQASNLIQDLPLHYPIAETESSDLAVLEELLAFVSAAAAEEQQYFVLDENNEHALEVARNYYNEQLEDKSSYPAILLGNLMCLLDDNCSDFYPELGNGKMQFRKAGLKAITQRVPAHADFKLFPNPTTSFTSLAYQINSSSKSFSLSIYNTQGHLIKRMELAKSRDEIVIDTDQLVPGLYLVQLRDENGLILGSGKLVKK